MKKILNQQDGEEKKANKLADKNDDPRDPAALLDKSTHTRTALHAERCLYSAMAENDDCTHEGCLRRCVVIVVK